MRARLNPGWRPPAQEFSELPNRELLELLEPLRERVLLHLVRQRLGRARQCLAPGSRHRGWEWRNRVSESTHRVRRVLLRPVGVQRRRGWEWRNPVSARRSGWPRPVLGPLRPVLEVPEVSARLSG